MARLVFPAHTGQHIAHTVETPTSAASPHRAVNQRRTFHCAAGARLWRAGAWRRLHRLLGHLHPSGAGAQARSRRSIGLASPRSCLAPLFLRNVRRGDVVRGRRVWLLAAAAGLFFMLDVAFWNTSLFLTNAPMRRCWRMSHRLSWGWCALLVFHERLRISYWLGLAIALCGMGVIIGHDLFSGSGLGAGDLLAMMAGFFYALYMLVIQRVRVSMDTLSSLWISTVVGTVLLLALNIALGRSMWGFTPSQYVTSSRWGLISQVAGYLAINYALGHLPASIVSPTLLGQPILTALLAVPFLSELLEPRQILGGVVALLGIFLVNRGVNR